MNKGEYRRMLSSHRWKTIRNTFKRDKASYKCWICGSDNFLNIHHLSYKKKLFFDYTNLVVLCGRHHKMLHWMEGTFNPRRNFKSVKELKQVFNESRNRRGKFKMSIHQLRKHDIKIPVSDWC